MRPRRIVLGALVLVAACMPRLSPLVGIPAPANRLPRATLAPGHRKLVFNWELEDREMSGRGEGAARIASPDTARLDFVLAGGFGSGAAVLIGDAVQTPSNVTGGDLIRRLVPPPPMLWAALGRTALPNLPDTVIRVEGTTLRADLGRPVAWRLTFHGDTLVRAERVEGGRVAEWVERSDSAHIRYRNEGSRRSLRLTITRSDEVPGFDASIWRFDR
ncbi:MAG TPA: hypothetical protein VKP00_10515 [Gemmatimonadaceae bacterium]|nr:hypothetical protein [Gemmatimonadaceae bacterium]